MRDKDLLKQLLKDGWVEKSVNGSHHKLVKGNRTGPW
jgi:predicted RNA binding protein YcfA (HicA-like mRNA interferase family)